MSDFTAKITAILDSSQAEAQINNLTKPRQLDIQVNFKKENNFLNSLNNSLKSSGTSAGNNFVSSFNNTLNKINVSNGMSAIANMQRTLKTMKFDRSSIDILTKDLNEMNLSIQRVSTNMRGNNLDIRIKGIDEWGRAVSVVKQFDSHTGRITTTSKRITQSFNQISTASQKMASSFQIAKLDAQMTTWLNNNTKASNQYRSSVQQLQKELQNLSSSGQIPLSKLKDMQQQMGVFAAQAKAAGVNGKSFEGTFVNISKYVSTAALITQSVSALKDMANNVIQIDSAMTELKKVTDESASSYDKFLSSASKRSVDIGTTISDYINSTADFARLGNSLSNAQKLAEVANIYNVVGDELSGIDAASRDIISTMSAFDVETDNAISIVDKFNEVSNNFAISSGGIGEALTRSASSMAAAGNTLDETIALVTAANTVVQDSASVGTAFKTKFF